MRLGQQSFVYFLAKNAAYVVSFLAVVYFARLVDPSTLGIYYVVIGLLSWLQLPGNMGISSAIKKRVSEGTDADEHVTAGVIVIGALFVITAALLFVFRGHVTAYIGADVTEYLVFLLFAGLSYSIVQAVLEGRQLVHVSGLLFPVKVGGRSLLQILLVIAGFELVGMLVGFATGVLVAAVLGATVLALRFRRPARRHFENIGSFAKYSWLGSVQSRTFNWIDILILNVFVSSALVGSYSVAWNVAAFLNTFGVSVSRSIFPEISKLSTDDGIDSTTHLIEDALSYAGLMLIPGFIGGLLIGDRVIRLYGAKYVTGTAVLGILIAACLVNGYQRQLLTTFNALDRPDLAFRVNAVFVASNVVLNVAFVTWFGWIGAAYATLLTVSVATCASFLLLSRLVTFSVPVTEIGRQWLAAITMGVVIHITEPTIAALEGAIPFGTAVGTICLVAIGAAVYFLTLIGISRQFRTTVGRNLPVDTPW
ncbi:polysaccharide biosynthesis C-terminal domain-containing protein [Natrinema pallidum]|uniref:Transporter n=1 Tax=Natrinema pallidum TaxID=69527 RepID=A0A4P9TDE9_9EURY|nr:polysaccharide biosynthesis C-terminal domain-containing protein [Natrinema pallidum]QCW02751.1 transporter [Natrinema pallidum]